MRFFCICIALTLPFSALADANVISRSDGFLLIWESINRPAVVTSTTFDDVPENTEGFLEISYAKNRGILNKDDDTFRPDEPLTLRDALLWIFRTRNVRELPDMQEEHLASMIADYPLVEMNRSLEGSVTAEHLVDFMRTLDEMLVKEVHEVSNYGEAFHGNGTAFGDTFDMNAMTAAHRSFPNNTLVEVTNVKNGKSVIVRINDRGPYVDGRDMDLSAAAFQKISENGGILNATFKRLGDADVINSCTPGTPSFQRRIARGIHFFRGIPRTFAQGDQLVLQSNRPFVMQYVTFPDGQKLRMQDFVLPGEKYRFTPDVAGMYVFGVGDTLGRLREMQMEVTGCQLPIR